MAFAHAPYAALILPDAAHLDATPYLRAARGVLRRFDAASGSEPQLGETGCTLRGDSFGLRIVAEEFSDFGPRILFKLMPAGDRALDPAHGALVLSETLRAALRFSDADIVEWGAPERLIDVDAFLRERPDAPLQSDLDALFRAPAGDLPLAPPSALTARLLAQCETLRNKEPGSLRMGAASWAMTGTVACIAPPIGASMTILGLMRGLDFRRVTQALSLTAVFVLLQNQGAISQVAQSVLP